MPRRLLTPLVVLTVVLTLVVGCGDDGPQASGGGEMTVSGATVSLPPNPVQASVHLVVENSTGSDDVLESVSSPVAESVSIHRTVIDQAGQASMDHQDSVEVPQGSKVTFAPGDLHVMLDGITEPLVVGQSIPLELRFTGAGIVTTSADVVPAGADLESQEHE